LPVELGWDAQASSREMIPKRHARSFEDCRAVHFWDHRNRGCDLGDDGSMSEQIIRVSIPIATIAIFGAVAFPICWVGLALLGF
jgi:hypothetical protein